jgi:hypothetical protein
MKRVQRISVSAILAGAIGAPAGIPAPIPREVLPMTPAPARLPVEGEFPSLAGATAWLNSPPLTPKVCAARSSSSTSGHLHQLAAHASLRSGVGGDLATS